MPVVYVDERERNSKVPQLLTQKGVTVIYKFLEVGDYIVSNRVGIERKSAADFAKSIVDGRLFDQASRLKAAFEKPIIIVEGSIFKATKEVNLRRSALVGAYLALALDMDITVINTLNEEETAEVIKRIALRESDKSHGKGIVAIKRPVQKPTSSDVTEWQLYILQAFPHVGPKIAVRILENFGSIVNFCNASLSELARVEGLSESKAAEIYRILHAVYKGFKGADQTKSGHKSLDDYLKQQ
jgi:DNA excision repair protein ERCC-4